MTYTSKPKPIEGQTAQAVDPASPLFGAWLPIATIPDGVEVLVTCGGICSPAVAQWSELEQCWIGGDDDDDRKTDREEWPLTHWMPLPAPPNVRPLAPADTQTPKQNGTL